MSNDPLSVIVAMLLAIEIVVLLGMMSVVMFLRAILHELRNR